MIELNSPYHLSYINFFLVITITICLLIYRFIFPKRKIHIFALLLIISVVPTLSIFRAGTYRSGDLTPHFVQLIDFYRNLSEGVLIPRWAGDLCGGYGCPVYILEYILPYYFASFFHFIGFSFLTSIKLVLVGAFITSGITMYLWAKEEFGKISGFLAAIFYLFAPYHLIDFHFRGSVGEILSFVFIPILFLFTKKLIETNARKYFFLETLAVFSLILTHSSTTIISLPLAVCYAVIVWFRKKDKSIKDIVLFFASIIYGILLSTFYWLPALREVQYTWWVNTTFGDFKPIAEYLYSPILYGFLFQGHQGEFRLIIGYFHLLAIFLAIFFLLKNKIDKNLKFLLLFLLLSFFILFFMLLSVSKPVWEHISLLHTFIVVWRLLVPIAFITSAIAGIVATKIKNIVLFTLVCFLVIVSTIPNWANRKMIPPPKDPFIHGSEFYTEYFEKGNPIFEKSLKESQSLKINNVSSSPTQPIVFLKGEGEFAQLKRKQIQHEYVLYAKKDVVIRENTNYFPGWKVVANNKNIAINYKDIHNLGKITFKLKKGIYKIDVLFVDTPVIRTSQEISAIAFIIGLLFCIPIVKTAIIKK